MRLAGVPGHRRAASVAALEGRPEADAIGVAQILEGKLRLGQAKLLTLIEADRTAQGGEHRDGDLRHIVPFLRLMGKTADMAGHVMV